MLSLFLLSLIFVLLENKDKANDVCSISEQKCNKLTSVENTAKIIEYTRNYTTKVYPAYFRQDSSNMNPLDVWLYGFQIGN